MKLEEKRDIIKIIKMILSLISSIAYIKELIAN